MASPHDSADQLQGHGTNAPADGAAPAVDNRILASLPARERAELEPSLERVQLASGDALLSADAPVTHVFFPAGAVAVLRLGSSRDPAAADVAVIGCEGVVGLSALLGLEDAGEQVSVRIAGHAYRAEVAALRRAAARLPALRPAIDRYTYAFLRQLAQSALCNRAHSVAQRIAALLLLMQDGAGANRLVLTHAQLGAMLGVRRAGVTEAMTGLRAAGAVGHHRGSVTIDDREGLHRVACGCYDAVREQYDRLIAPARVPS